MISRRSRFAAALLVSLIAPHSGCGSSTESTVSGAEPSPVEQVGQLLRMHREQNRPTPRTLKEAQKSGTALPRALEALRSGEVVIAWGLDLEEYGGTSVIGYEKDAPDKGGAVVLGDGTVVELTAEEFQAASKPPASRFTPPAGGRSKSSR
ncbi:hypothetical protein [Planctomyces sp. SH-PL62]|uniref:hypothetical protein n=1 Tax=Planctomyces sp. SH-PL62 TaxID=1636152 RepID=UPI00078C2975|nr:hypothetical protein [Planctomyces sp. SH-PL62]AMV35961.1 hypothetical protein VT85_00855 [Planctomyces sp. SH-PL62]